MTSNSRSRSTEMLVRVGGLFETAGSIYRIIHVVERVVLAIFLAKSAAFLGVLKSPEIILGRSPMVRISRLLRASRGASEELSRMLEAFRVVMLRPGRQSK